MIEALKIIFLSIVHSVTAALPVSSLGHFSLLKEVLGYTDENFNAVFYFSVFSLASALAMYFYNIRLHGKIIRNVFKSEKKAEAENTVAYKRAGKNVILSLLPMTVLIIPVGKGKFLGDTVNFFLSDGSLIFVGIASIFCGLLMLVSYLYAKREKAERMSLISTENAVFFGIYQLPCYIFPGLSHIGIGMSRTSVSDTDIKNILKEAYLYLAPSLIVVYAVKAVLSFESEGFQLIPCIAGFIISLVVSYGVMVLMNKCFSKRVYKAFIIYTFVFGLIVAAASVYIMFA